MVTDADPIVNDQARPAFDPTARELAKSILDFLQRYVGDRATAEDLLQETLIRMDRGLASFEGRSSLKTWAFSIASRVAADYLRHPDRRATLVDLDAADEVADPTLDAGARLVIGEMNDCIRKTIDSLPDSYRTALILHDLEGMTADQVAEIAECSLATAKVRIHRARQRLKQALASGCTFYRDDESVLRCDRKHG
ncbi:MAG: RNA polymerase sigma factor [Gammaproteobacteria bacterium]|nr:RNA polymerase sigma factor [Gammaproteobacteria bacterium]